MALQGDDDTWSPPSEPDMKVIRARRERQDKISRLMGDYLLKGYRMLGDSCEECGTILLQDRQRKLLCISCQELDSDTEKDNPALNPQAALSQVREQQLSLQDAPVPDIASSALPRSNMDSVSVNPVPPPSVPVPPLSVTVSAPSVPVPPSSIPVPIHSAEAALLEKITWATHQLKETSSVEFSSQLCNLIGSCAQTLRSLRDLRY
ncbi:protein ZNRD2 [Gastrophryne carolinensis]